mgnify:CR=1 FL=1
MTGTLVNVAAVVAGGLVGLVARKGVSKPMEKALNQALGVAVVVIGINGVVTNMVSANADGSLSSSGELLFSHFRVMIVSVQGNNLYITFQKER